MSDKSLGWAQNSMRRFSDSTLWKERPCGQVGTMDLAGARVLVTGATGLIGGRVVDQLIDWSGVTVRIFARNPAKIHRFDGYVVETVIGDITDPDCVRRAVHGCDVVVHSVMAKGDADTRLVNVEGTRYVLDAALASGVSRVVHVSSAVVYTPWPDGVVDETFPRVPDGSGTSYHDTKLESEELALQYYRDHRLPVVVVQPVAVYGPRAEAWTIGPLRQLRRNTIILVNGATAHHDFVYVDDVALGMVLAATAEGIDGETYLLAGSEKIPTKEFYARYQHMLGLESTVCIGQDELEGTADPLCLLKERGLATDKPPVVVSAFATRTFFSSERARRRLGYEPQFNLERGMQLTQEWAEHEGLLATEA